MTRRAPRAGYTLIEMVLVVALIVLLSAMAYPSLDGMYADLKVQAAADEVRAQCVAARTNATNEGRPWSFAVMPNSDRSRVAPLELAGSSDHGDGSESARPVERTLPKGVTFGQVENGPASGGPSPAGQPGGQMGGVDSAGFTTAVVFLPGGTAQEDKDIVISVRGAKPLVVRVRALTGVVTVQPYHPEKGQP